MSWKTSTFITENENLFLLRLWLIWKLSRINKDRLVHNWSSVKSPNIVIKWVTRDKHAKKMTYPDYSETDIEDVRISDWNQGKGETQYTVKKIDRYTWMGIKSRIWTGREDRTDLFFLTLRFAFRQSERQLQLFLLLQLLFAFSGRGLQTNSYRSKREMQIFTIGQFWRAQALIYFRFSQIFPRFSPNFLGWSHYCWWKSNCPDLNLPPQDDFCGYRILCQET